MQLTITSITIEHAAGITALSAQFGYNATLEETESRIQKMIQHQDHCGFVALADTTVVGWIHAFYTFRLESEAFVEIGGLVVDEQIRQMGIGRKLVKAVMEWCSERSIGKIRVRCQTTRTSTHAFYTSAGFTETKEQKVFDLKIISSQT